MKPVTGSAVVEIVHAQCPRLGMGAGGRRTYPFPWYPLYEWGISKCATFDRNSIHMAKFSVNKVLNNFVLLQFRNMHPNKIQMC